MYSDIKSTILLLKYSDYFVETGEKSNNKFLLLKLVQKTQKKPLALQCGRIEMLLAQLLFLWQAGEWIGETLKWYV